MEPKTAAFLSVRASKLAKRLERQRLAGDALAPGSILREMNDRIVFDMEVKLFKFKNRPARVITPN